MTKIVLIQVLFLPLLLNKKIKMKTQNTMALFAIKKSALLKTRESHFSVAWIMELINISLCLGKFKVFAIILACQS